MRLYRDSLGREVMEWSLWPWLWPEDEEAARPLTERINAMQTALGPLPPAVRRIRAHIASLVPCDIGVPVTIDELLLAIGSGVLPSPSYYDGCWIPAPWWETRTTQPDQTKSMQAIESILLGYIDGRAADEVTAAHPYAAGFIRRAWEWLGPRSELGELQLLLLQRALLPFRFFAKHSEDFRAVDRDCFRAGGAGEALDKRIAELGGLPPIVIHDWEATTRNRETIEDPAKRELYRVCCRIAWGVSGLCDCHHNTFRNIEGWTYGIGQLRPEIPTRRHGTEAERLARLLFGYCLGLDRWLAGVPLAFLLLDLGHIALSFDPHADIQRVYAYLGEATPLKRWLAACLWLNLRYNRPAGLTRHKDLLAQAGELGVSVNTWCANAA